MVYAFSADPGRNTPGLGTPMDVRCENCGTEYELDEERLKPGGLTVQCTTCGHTFKVGGRMSTALGIGSRSPSPGAERLVRDPEGDARTITSAMSETPSGAMAAAADPVADGTPLGPMDISPSRGTGRNWLIRLPSGQIETCRELATLQQWIVAGKVTRYSGISRTGKTWKRLGDIKDLASFFQIADEARAAAPAYAGEHGARPDPAATLLGVPVAQHLGPGSAPVARAPSAPVARPPSAPMHAAPSAPVARAPSAPVAAPSISPAPAGSDAGAGAAPAGDAPADEAEAAPRPRHVFAHAAGGSGESAWRGSLRGANADGDDGPRGPTGGLGRHAQEAAFTGTPIRPRDEKRRSSEPLLPDDDEALSAAEARGGAGRWIVLLSLLLMAGAAAVVYQFVFRDGGFTFPGEPTAALVDAAPDAGDAGDAGSAIPDAGPALNSEQEAILAAVDERIAADTRAGLEAMEGELEAIAASTAGADEILDLLVARARVHTALAQQAFDASAALAESGDEDASRGMRRQADERVLEALALAQKARRLDREHAGALVVMADILRLQGRPATQIDGYLEQAMAQDRNHHEARLVRALALAASDRGQAGGNTQARALLAELAARKDDVRPLYRLALLDLQARRFDQAEEHTAQVIAVQPTHEGALAMPARIREAMAVDTSDPMPPEEGAPGGDAPGGEGGPDGDDDGRRGASGGTYDSLLARANRKRQAGNCAEALDLFERAIELNPIGVEALTGMGYCHIDRREFSSAHGKFRAALGVSSRSQDALWGIAESYAAQGLNAQAVQWYERYLDEHPNGSRAAAARSQIERLGAPAPGDTPEE